MTVQNSPRIRCRLIDDADRSALIELLRKGFPVRSGDYWARALDRLARRDAPETFPRFGYLLECNGAPVGVILLIFTIVRDNSEPYARCNISSWYVDPVYRSYASLLIAAALRERSVTYVNISPAPPTWPLIEAQGFSRYCDGMQLTFPALGAWVANTRVRVFDRGFDYGSGLSAAERNILLAHADMGCICLAVIEKRDVHPFVFVSRRMFKALVPVMQLAYCRDVADYARFAGPLGRVLSQRGGFAVLADSNGPIPGAFGKYFADRGPKYFKGPHKPRLGDLSYSEAVLFG